MALTNPYADIDAVCKALNITTNNENTAIEPFIDSACRAIDSWCGQFFYDSGASTARTFRVRDSYCARVAPFLTTVTPTIKTDADDDGTFETTWSASDYELERFGGDMGEMMGAPYFRINAVGSYYFPTNTRRSQVLQVTAQWGWAAIPEQVMSAAVLISGDLWSRRRNPHGIATTDFGPIRISGTVADKVHGLIGHLRRYDLVGGIA